MKIKTQPNVFMIVLILLILCVVFVKCMCVAKEYWWFGTKKEEEEEEEDDNGLDESTVFGSGDRGWDGKPWVYNGNNQNVKGWIDIINKRFKTPPKPKSCMEINTNIHGYFADLRDMMKSEPFQKTPSEILEIMNNAQYEIATIIDPSWKNKYTKDTLPEYFPTTPETEFYGLNKPVGMLTDENNVNPLLNELGCKKVVIPTVFPSVYIPTSTDAQITTARELITTVKKFDANNVNCADAALTFMMLTILVDEPGVGRDHPDVGRANWVLDTIPVSTKCSGNPVPVFLEDEDEDEDEG